MKFLQGQSDYIALMKKFAKALLLPDSLNVEVVYQNFCNIIKKASEKAIQSSHLNNCILCWEVNCESLYTTLIQSPQGDDSSLAATTGSGGVDGLKQFGASNFYTLDIKHRVY